MRPPDLVRSLNNTLPPTQPIVGSGEVHEASVGENTAWWYRGAWNLQGEWNKDEELINLAWKQGEYVYQLIGESIDVYTLIHIAESLK